VSAKARPPQYSGSTPFSSLVLSYYPAIAFAPDGRILANANSLGFLSLWDMVNQKERGIDLQKGLFSEALSVTFSLDGRMLASGSVDGTVTLWDVASGQVKTMLKGPGDSVRAVAFAPDGRTLVSGSDDKTVKLWDIASGQERATLRRHGTSVLSVAFAPDGRMVASAGDGWVGADSKKVFPILLWRGATDDEVARQCVRYGRKE
jgi:WD40 repeat protein